MPSPLGRLTLPQLDILPTSVSTPFIRSTA